MEWWRVKRKRDSWGYGWVKAMGVRIRKDTNWGGHLQIREPGHGNWRELARYYGALE